MATSGGAARQNAAAGKTAMMPAIFTDLLRGALPPAHAEAVLADMRDHAHNREDWRAACADALRANKSIDWDCYLAMYADVAASGADPVWHFLRHGIFEGRQLRLRAPGTCALADGPRISIIIPSRDSGHFLENALDRLVRQSLEDIEIIVVDDASADDTQAVLARWQSRDQRVRAIRLAEGGSQHMARKAGVAAARGRWIMFMDADDALAQDACQMAWEAAQGYDIACFNVTLLAPSNMEEAQKSRYMEYLNRGQAGVLRGGAILEAALAGNALSDLLWNKIYDASLCKAAFAGMADGFFDNGEDIYEAVTILAAARTVRKISAPLYIYRLKAGRERECSMAPAALWQILQKEMANTPLAHWRSFLQKRFLAEAANAWLAQSGAKAITYAFNIMTDSFGAAESIAFLARRHFKDWKTVADVFTHYEPTYRTNTAIRRIGILYEEFAKGPIARAMLEIWRQLHESGHEIILFLAKQHPDNELVPEYVQVIYAPLEWYNETCLQGHISALERAVAQNPVDVMICPCCWDNPQLWQAMLLRRLGIPVLMHNLQAWNERLMSTDKDYNLAQQTSVLRCADKVICHTRAALLFYRANGIDAELLPYPLPPIAADIAKSPTPLVAIMGQLDNGKGNMRHNLLAFARICAAIPEAQGAFIGCFGSAPDRVEFYELARRLDILENISVSGWDEDYAPLLAKAWVIMSASRETEPAGMSAWAEQLDMPQCAQKCGEDGFYNPAFPVNWREIADNAIQYITNFKQDSSADARQSQFAINFEQFMNLFAKQSTYHTLNYEQLLEYDKLQNC